MDGFTLGAIAAPIVGGILGDQQSRGAREAAERARADALRLFQEIQLPGIEEQKLVLEQLRSAGQLTPELEQALTQGRTEMDQVSTDPRLKQAQLQALSELQNVGAQGGMNATERANFSKMQSDLGRQAGAQQAAIMQDMARRGQSGSGMELAAQLMGQQASAERASQQGMDIKAQAERRALEALMQSGQLGGQIRSQDFNEQASRAQAQDAINRFNVQNRQSVQGANIDRRNSAQATNLQNAQRISDGNVNIRNQQQTHNKGLLQQQFNNQMARAGGMAGQYQGIAQQQSANADRIAGQYAGVGAGIGEGLSSYQSYLNDKDRNAAINNLASAYRSKP